MQKLSKPIKAVRVTRIDNSQHISGTRNFKIAFWTHPLKEET